MKSEDFYQLLNDKVSPSRELTPVLEEVIDNYPWFHTIRSMYLKNLALTDDSRLGMKLKKMSVFIPDRRRLFMHIEGTDLLPYLSQVENASVKVEDTFLLIDSFLSSHSEENKYNSDTSVITQPSVSSDYIYWAYSTNVNIESEEEADHKLKHHKLIDTFIEEEKNRPPGIRLPSEDKESLPVQEDNHLPEDSGSDIKVLDDSYFTETLARIYIKQKRYDKALQIIKNLSLKYPEKNVYFADQIRFLEKLIINNKK